MSTAHTTDAAATTDASTVEPTNQKPARTGRRWPWIAALVVVAALGAAGTGIAASSAADAQNQLAATQEQLATVEADYADLETRSNIAQSSLDLIREQRDRLELQLEELQGSEG